MLATHLKEPHSKKGFPKIEDALEHWSSQISLASHSIGDLQHKKLSPLHRLANGVLSSKVGVIFAPLTEHCVRLLIGMVSANVTLAANRIL